MLFYLPPGSAQPSRVTFIGEPSAIIPRSSRVAVADSRISRESALDGA
jgi:hypothetical protein